MVLGFLAVWEDGLHGSHWATLVELGKQCLAIDIELDLFGEGLADGDYGGDFAIFVTDSALAVQVHNSSDLP